MRALMVGIALGVLGTPVWAAQERAVDLKDGGTLVIRENGDMVHVDCAGNRARMRDGGLMEGKDGTRFVMKNDPAWRQILQKGSLNPKL